MHNAAEIYGNQVRQMPSVERLRLATLILEELTIEQRKATKSRNNSQPYKYWNNLTAGFLKHLKRWTNTSKRSVNLGTINLCAVRYCLS